MTLDEFHQRFNLGEYGGNAEFNKLTAESRFAANLEPMNARHLEVQDRPDEVNWVALGAVTPVKNQVSWSNAFSV